MEITLCYRTNTSHVIDFKPNKEFINKHKHKNTTSYQAINAIMIRGTNLQANIGKNAAKLAAPSSEHTTVYTVYTCS